MNSRMNSKYLICVTGWLLLSVSSGLNAQTNSAQTNSAQTNSAPTDSAQTGSTQTNHSQHQPIAEVPTADESDLHRDHLANETNNQVESGLRDPHAYSNGFELTGGPYALADQRQLKLADEKIFAGLWMDRLEGVEIDDQNATVFEGYGWLGGSYRRLLLKAEGELINSSVEEAELDLLWSTAFSPFWNVQFGARREIGVDANRNWLVFGVSGLAPYWFEVDANLYLGENGRSALDVEVEYEMLLTQRLVLQPRLDLSAYGESDRSMGRGKGLAEVITGARLRYEFSRQFAPYIGIERASKFGKTAALLPPGIDRHDTRWTIGVKFWF